MQEDLNKNKELNNVTDLRGNGEKRKEKNKKGKKITIMPIILIVIVAFLILNGIFAYGIYKQNWGGKITRNFLNIFPYPAVMVNGSFVRLNNYYKDLDSYKNYYQVAQKTDFSSEEGKKILETLKKDLLIQLTEEKIIAKEAKKLKIKVDNQEVEDEYKKLVEANGEETLKKQIKEYYNWDVKIFKEKIKLTLLRKKLEEKIKLDESLNAEKKKRAEEVLAKIKNGEDFAQLAKEFSEDVSATEGGNLGTTEKGEMVQEFEDAALALNPGETSNIVKTTFGFHIIKLADKKENTYSVSHILIKSVSFEDWLKTKQDEYKVKNLINPENIKN